MGSRIRRVEVSLRQKKGNWYKNEAVLGKDLGSSAQGSGWCEHSRIGLGAGAQKQKVTAKLKSEPVKQNGVGLKGNRRCRVFKNSKV